MSINQALEKNHRCWWCGDDPQYQDYHDNEWGVPVYDNIRLFEKICLEGFQSGLSWLTILRKRENFRAAFDGFDYHKIVHYTQDDVQRLLQDVGIIRHRGKIEATINNAARALEMIEEFGSLSDFFWQHKPRLENRPKVKTKETISALAYTPESTSMSKALKKRGWKFVGPTTCYAFMQSMGIVNDHIEGCFLYSDEHIHD